MGLLIQLLVFVLVIGLVFHLIGILPLDAKLMQIVRVIVVVICLIFLLDVLFGSFGGSAFNGYRWR